MKKIKFQRLKKSEKLIIFILLVIIFIISINKNYKIFILKQFIKVKENIRPDNNDSCDNLDPIKLFNLRLENGQITICQNGKSKHICYLNNNDDYNNILYTKNGVICKMENIVLDPSKSNQTNIIYKGPVDEVNRGCPLLSKGFFNIKCQNKRDLENYNDIYKSYFQSWNYPMN